MAKLTVSRFNDLDETRAHYLATVDAEAERLRTQYLTPGNGQAMTYEAKHREALAGGGAMITAEAEALGVTEQEVIGSVLAARERWELAGAKIEAARLKAKRDIRAAGTPAEMHQVVKQITDTMGAI